jgi:hypothetical protein
MSLKNMDYYFSYFAKAKRFSLCLLYYCDVVPVVPRAVGSGSENSSVPVGPQLHEVFILQFRPLYSLDFSLFTTCFGLSWPSSGTSLC